MKGKALPLLQDDACMDFFSLDNFNVDNGSVSFWINPSSMSSGYSIMAIGQVWIKVQTSSLIDGYVKFGPPRLGLMSRTPLPLNKWSQVLISWGGSVPGINNGTTQVYINGNLDSSTYSRPIFNTSSSLEVDIGGDGPSNDDSVTAVIDEVEIYSQSLQTAEVKKIYAEGLSRHQTAAAIESLGL